LSAAMGLNTVTDRKTEGIVKGTFNRNRSMCADGVMQYFCRG
jgi:hypothetical protein